MDFLEKDLEQIIYEADNGLLNSRGLPISGKKLRQIRIGNYGVSDLITIEKSYKFSKPDRLIPYLKITILELKKNIIGIDAFLQSIKYARGVKLYLEQRKNRIKYEIDIMLIGKSIELETPFVYITDILPKCKNSNIDFLKIYTYSYSISGIKFNRESNYLLTESGFRYEK